MKNNRRDFLKKVSITGLTALVLPEILMGNTELNNVVKPDVISKKFLFQGDSITDGGRSRNMDWNHVLGHGYAYLIASRLNYEYPDRDYQFFNRGISGNKVSDLTARWQTDTLDIKPDILSILIGINDAFGLIERGEKATADDFGHIYEALLAQTIKFLPQVKLVLCEPFILPVGMVKNKLDSWTIQVQERQVIVKQLAQQYNAVFVPLQKAFDKATAKAPADHWIWDGIHPMPAGHELIAREWISTVNKHYKIL